MSGETVKKYPRFGYFHVKIGFDEKAITILIKKYNGSTKNEDTEICKALEKCKENISSDVDMFKLILLAIRNKSASGFQEIGGKKIDIDISTFRPNAEGADHVYFQMANNRSDTVYKKKIGSEREIVDLEDDEYIGEYCSALYHFEKRMILLQRNRYSVSVSQFEAFFQLCISNYYQKNISEDSRISFPIFVRLVPDLDQKMLDKIKRGNIEFEKIKICGDAAKINHASKLNMPCIQGLEKIINGFSGYEFSIEIKAKKEKGRFSESLSPSNVQDLYEYHRNCREEDELQIITQMKDGEIRDVLDWSVPKRERVIPITYSRQNPPKIDDLYKKMKKVFDENMPDLHG